MIRLLKYPAVNAVCISLFTIFYAVIFLRVYENIDFESSANFEYTSLLWQMWCDFLIAGNQIFIAYALIAVTVAVVILLVLRPRPHDEYQTAILTNCLVTATVLTLIAIAIFFVLILHDPSEILQKFTLFITIHWVSVVFANLTYVLMCRWR